MNRTNNASITARNLQSGASSERRGPAQEEKEVDARARARGGMNATVEDGGGWRWEGDEWD